MFKSLIKAAAEFFAFILFLEAAALTFQYLDEFNNILKEYRAYTLMFMCFYVFFRGVIVDAERRTQKCDMQEMFEKTLKKYDLDNM